MKITRLFTLILLLIISTSFWVQAQVTKTFVLNEVNEELDEKIKANSSASKIYFTLNEAVFEDSDFTEGAVFSFDYGIGKSSDFVVTRIKEYMPGSLSVTARKKGQQENAFIITYSNGSVHGIYHDTHEKSYQIKSNREGRNYVEINNNEMLACGLHEEADFAVPHINSAQTSDQAKKKGSVSGYTPALNSFSVDDSVTIDLMLVYTNAAENWADTSSYGSIDVVINQAMKFFEAALDNSKTGIELRLVYAHKTDYDEINDGVESGDRLRRLSRNPIDPQFSSEYSGYMNEVHDLRNQYGADIVSLLAKIDDTGGLGWLLGSSSGSPAYGFNLNRVQQVANGYTLIHEIGHNMGSAHSRTQQSNFADDSGGLFHYSVGYQDFIQNFHTVMAYSDGLQQAPLFSSPDLTFNGMPAGYEDVKIPENNTRSLKEVKRAVAGYRLTEIDSPVASLSTNNISVNLSPGEELLVNVDILNSGESQLMWEVDFGFPTTTAAKAKHNYASSGEIEKPEELTAFKRAPANYSGNYKQTHRKSTFEEETIYSTSFEGNEGFDASGSYLGYNEWRSLTSSKFEISTENPKTGTQNLRLEYDGESEQFISAPFFGYIPFGSFEVTINFSINGSSDTSLENEIFDFRLNDGRNGERSSWVTITNGTIYTWYLDELYNLTNGSNGVEVQSDTYYELKIIYDNKNENVDFYLDGNLLSSRGYLIGLTPGYLEILHRNGTEGTYIDVDDIEIKQLSNPYSWLNVDNLTGVFSSEETDQISLNFDTNDLDPGTYETMMEVRTNDPQNEVIEVPITLNVDNAVSNETADAPQKITLAQNYPNPFNPTTAINYTLGEAQTVQLDVFNIQGQKVATLLQNERVGAGEHTVTFDASALSSGIYMYRLKTASQTLTRQMVLIK